MHPLTHPLPVTAHVPVLDDGTHSGQSITNGTTRTADQDLESV